MSWEDVTDANQSWVNGLWILRDGVWDDEGIWMDFLVWVDGVAGWSALSAPSDGWVEL